MRLTLPLSDGTGGPPSHDAQAAGVYAARTSVSVGFRADVAHDFGIVRDRWERLAASGAAWPFQRANWLSAWYATHGRAPGVTPLLVTIRGERGEDLAAFPLVLRRTGGLRVIEPADGGITDYNAPILAPQAARTPQEAKRLRDALFAALPPADLFAWQKLPSADERGPGLFALAGSVVPCVVAGRQLGIPGCIDAWLQGRSPRARDKSRRSWAQLDKLGDARFIRARTPDETERLFAALKCLQARRMARLGMHYTLDDPVNAEFYDRLVATGGSDDVILMGLEIQGELVAVIMGVGDGACVCFTRFTIAEGHHDRLSPGMLLAEATIRTLHQEGYRLFDFTIGSYEFKRRLQMSELPLLDVYKALSWRGLPRVLLQTGRQKARRYPRLVGLMRGLRGRLPA